jgi:hypothetical protein
MAEDYKVGYGKPPQHSRFKKGRSGHPEGRPRGSPNVTSELKGLLAAKTAIKLNGALQKVPTARAICLALIQKALGGDVRAFSKIVDIIGPAMADELKATASPSSADVDILRRALDRAGERTPGSSLPARVENPAKEDQS